MEILIQCSFKAGSPKEKKDHVLLISNDSHDISNMILVIFLASIDNST